MYRNEGGLNHHTLIYYNQKAMKKMLLLVLTAIIVMMTIGELAAQNSPFAKKKPLPNTRGKATAKELGKEIFDAMQTGRTDRLLVYLPSDKELKALSKHDRTHEKTKELVESLNAQQLEESFKADLSTVQNQLMTDAFSPALATLGPVAGGRAKIPGVVPVTVTLLDASQKPVNLTFEALRIEKRLFLLRNLQVQKEMPALNPENSISTAKP